MVFEPPPTSITRQPGTQAAGLHRRDWLATRLGRRLLFDVLAADRRGGSRVGREWRRDFGPPWQQQSHLMPFAAPFSLWIGTESLTTRGASLIWAAFPELTERTAPDPRWPRRSQSK